LLIVGLLGNKIRTHGAIHIAEALEVNNTVDSFDLSGECLVFSVLVFEYFNSFPKNQFFRNKQTIALDVTVQHTLQTC